MAVEAQDRAMLFPERRGRADVGWGAGREADAVAVADRTVPRAEARRFSIARRSRRVAGAFGVSSEASGPVSNESVTGKSSTHDTMSRRCEH